MTLQSAREDSRRRELRLQLELMRGCDRDSDADGLTVPQDSRLRPFLVWGKEYCGDWWLAKYAPDAKTCLDANKPQPVAPPAPPAGHEEMLAKVCFPLGRDRAAKHDLFLRLPGPAEETEPPGRLRLIDARAAAVQLALMELQYSRVYPDEVKLFCLHHLALIGDEIRRLGRPGHCLTNAVRLCCTGLAKKPSAGHRLPGEICDC